MAEQSEQTRKMLASVNADPVNEDSMQSHRERQMEYQKGVHQFQALTGPVTMADVLDFMALLMEELPDVKGKTKKARKKSGKKVLLKAYNRWVMGERVE